MTILYIYYIINITNVQYFERFYGKEVLYAVFVDLYKQKISYSYNDGNCLLHRLCRRIYHTRSKRTGFYIIELRLFFYYEYIPALYYYNENVYVLYDPDVSGGGYAKRGEERTELPFVGTIDARCAAYNGRKTTAGRYDGLSYARIVGFAYNCAYKPISRVFTARDENGSEIDRDLFIYVCMEPNDTALNPFPTDSSETNVFAFRFARLAEPESELLMSPDTWPDYMNWANERLPAYIERHNLQPDGYNAEVKGYQMGGFITVFDESGGTAPGTPEWEYDAQVIYQPPDGTRYIYR